MFKTSAFRTISLTLAILSFFFQAEDLFIHDFVLLSRNPESKPGCLWCTFSSRFAIIKRTCRLVTWWCWLLMQECCFQMLLISYNCMFISFRSTWSFAVVMRMNKKRSFVITHKFIKVGVFGDQRMLVIFQKAFWDTIMLTVAMSQQLGDERVNGGLSTRLAALLDFFIHHALEIRLGSINITIMLRWATADGVSIHIRHFKVLKF